VGPNPENTISQGQNESKTQKNNMYTNIFISSNTVYNIMNINYKTHYQKM